MMPGPMFLLGQSLVHVPSGGSVSRGISVQGVSVGGLCPEGSL